VALTTADLHAYDPDNTADELSYRVSNVSQGFIANVSAPTIAIVTFTQADIDAGRLSYNHDGSENFSDSFGFSVDDGAGSSSAAPSASAAGCRRRTCRGQWVIHGRPAALPVGICFILFSPDQVRVMAATGRFPLAAMFALRLGLRQNVSDLKLALQKIEEAADAAGELGVVVVDR
jgi:hypothetical protein